MPEILYDVVRINHYGSFDSDTYIRQYYGLTTNKESAEDHCIFANLRNTNRNIEYKVRQFEVVNEYIPKEEQQ